MLNKSLIVFGMMAALMVGCESHAPQGSNAGRMDPYRTTNADRASMSANMPALLELSDQTASRFAAELANIPEVANSKERKTLYISTIENNTRTPTNNFVMIQRRVRDTLVGSTHLRPYFRFTNNPQTLDREKARLTGTGDPVNDSNLKNKRYDADDIYLLKGAFFESGRDTVRRYYFVFEVTNLETGEILLNKQMDLAQP